MTLTPLAFFNQHVMRKASDQLVTFQLKSQLINYFVSAANTNTIIAVVTGKRKREIGLVVPAKYFAYTNNKKNAEMLMKKLLEKKIFSNSLYTTKILLKDLVYFNL